MGADTTTATKRGRGRPKTFDRDLALDQAMRLFWDRGYEGTTFDQLTDTMGISPSSFYNAFGSKEQLFQEAATLYMAHAGEWFTAELTAPTDARTTFRNLLTASARQFTQCDSPSGCMVSLACTSVPPSLDSLRDLMAGLRRQALRAMADRLRQAVEAGELPVETDVGAMAAFYSALSKGMAVLARDGATEAELLAIVELGMRAWPDIGTPAP